MKLKRFVLAAVLGSLAVTAASAQTGGIRVRVVDASDKSAMIGVLVNLSNAQQLVAASAVLTDAQGFALFPVLRAGGGYIIDVRTEGYAPIRLPDLRVRIGETTDVPIAMFPEQEERVTVTAERQVVDLEKTSTSTKYSEEFIQDLPVASRLYQNVLTLAPGVQDADGDGNPNVHGARDRDFKATVNGVSNQDPLTGGWMNFVNADSIEEVEVVTAGAGAEYSRAQGGFAQIIQKQGSNDFEGVFGFLYRSSKLDGNGATSVNSDRLPQFDYLQPSISVSGPLMKDKLWYRLSHEYLSVDQPVNSLGGTVYVTKTKRTTNDDQITWQVSPRNKLAFQYKYDPQETTNVGVSNLRPPESTLRVERGGPVYSLNWVAPYSPKLFFDSLVSYQDFHLDRVPTTEGVPNNCGITNIPGFARAMCVDLNTGTVSGSNYFSWKDKRQRVTVKGDGTYYAGRFWGANHQFRFGMTVENERYYRELTRRPLAFFQTINVPREGGAGTGQQNENPFEPLVLASLSFARPESSDARAVGTNWGVYFEDEIKPLSNLVLKVGVRIDHESINSDGYAPFDPEAEALAYRQAVVADQPDPVLLQQAFTAYEGIQDFLNYTIDNLGLPPGLSLTGVAYQAAGFWWNTRRPGSIDLSNTNFAPRLSASWDPWSNGKTKFTASAGRFYDKIFLAVPLIELEPVTSSILLNAKRAEGEQGAFIVEPPSRAINPALNFSFVDRNLQTPYMDEITVGFERELFTETSLKVTYIRRNYKDQLQDINLNKVPGDLGKCNPMGTSTTPWIVPSPEASGEMTEDLFNPGTYYVDMADGPGDGILDDCAGGIAFGPPGGGLVTGAERLLFVPDGIPDLYVQNPGWGNMYFVSNFNTAKYDGLVVQLERRQYKNWQMDASYTWSKAIGDAEDFDLAAGDDRSLIDDERGYLSYDQRHVLKFNATTVTPWGFRLGTSVTWQSGLPYSLRTGTYSFSSIPPEYGSLASPDPEVRFRYPTRQRNDQRNVSYWNFDVKATKELSLPKGMNLQMSAEVFNLLNNDTLVLLDQVNGNNGGYRFFGRQFQLSFRLAF